MTVVVMKCCEPDNNMSLANLISLLILVVLVEGSTAQWRKNYTICNSPNCSSVAAETTAHVGQALTSGENTILADIEDGISCPHWLFPIHTENGSTTCECGDTVAGAVLCNNETQKVEVHRYYCMTYSSDNTSLVVGKCQCSAKYYYYHKSGPPFYYSLPSNISEVCDYFHRDGQLCGKCKDGFAPPVYSYDPSCVNCTEYSSNWVKYMAIAFLPLTALFLVVITFRVSATSGLLNVFVLVSQTVSAPFVVHTIVQHTPNLKLLSHIGLSLYGIWNLDFFRLLYRPFCLHPEMTTLQVLALDYAIAVYPLLLIVFTYLLVEMHDHNVRIVVWLWKPFHAYFVCFRKKSNVKGSLINAFATFLLLSYVNFLHTSFAFLFPVNVYNIHGRSKRYLFYDGTVEYCGPEHLPFAILAVAVVLVFNIFPLLLLLLYPCQCFQRCLNHFNIHSQVLHTFMDVFQGSYKDGSNGTRDCRWFTSLYLMLRIALLMMYTINNDFVLHIDILILLVPVFLTATFYPHKSPIHNIIDIFLLLTLIAVSISTLSIDVVHYIVLHSAKPSHFLADFFFGIPLLYFIVIILHKLLAHKRYVRKAHQKLCLTIPCSSCRQVNDEALWPDRLVNAEEYTPLLTTETLGN